MYWCKGMKREVAKYQRPVGPLLPVSVAEWRWDHIDGFCFRFAEDRQRIGISVLAELQQTLRTQLKFSTVFHCDRRAVGMYDSEFRGFAEDLCDGFQRKLE